MRIQRLIPTVVVGVLVLLAFSAGSAIAAPPETPVTNPATAVTATTAVLHGELNPNAAGGPGEWLFEYTPGLPAECEGEFLPESFGTALGHEKEAVEAEATKLHPNQIYSFCLAELGETFVRSPTLTFKTLPAAPVYAGGAKAAAVGPFSATLEALVNPNNEETKYSFEYSSTKPVGEKLEGTVTKVEGKSPLTGYSESEIVASLPTGNVLAPDMTYYFRVVAENAQSEKESEPVEGPIEQFTTGTPEPPVFVSQEATNINSSEPKLEAKINPNYQTTEYHFEYASKATGETLEGPITIIKGAPPLADLPAVFTEEGLLAGPIGLTGLQPGPTYYRVVATNNTGTTDGPVYEFLALGAPTDSTGAAGAPTRTSAPVSGAIDPQGLPTTYHFAYVPQAEYEPGAANPYAHGKSTYETKVAEENGTSILDYTAHPVGLTLEELQPGTTYDYALVASNELGTITGANQTFTTSPPTAPVATTGGAVGVSQLSGTITGSVDTSALQTAMQFEFGPTPYAGALLPATVVSSEGSLRGLAVVFSGELQPATTYYYRVVASNQDGVAYGAEESFSTPGFPAGFAPAAVIPFAPYTSIGTLDANEAKEGKATAPKSLTRGEKLAKALRGCGAKGRARRRACERKAREEFGPEGRKRAKK